MKLTKLITAIDAHACGEPGRVITLGAIFTGRLIEETQVGPYRAVVPTLSGQGWITAITQFVVDATDPFPDGFTVGDIWG